MNSMTSGKFYKPLRLILPLILSLVLIISLMPIPSFAMQIFVKLNLNGTHFTLEVEPTDRIGDIKTKIMDLKSYPVETQTLIFRDQVLDDENTLQDYSIQKDSTLTLIVSFGTPPKLRINSETNEWEVSYDNGVNWDSLGVNATGNKGDQGIKGDAGEKGEKGEKGDTGVSGKDGKNASNTLLLTSLSISTLSLLLNAALIIYTVAKKKSRT